MAFFMTSVSIAYSLLLRTIFRDGQSDAEQVSVGRSGFTQRACVIEPGPHPCQASQLCQDPERTLEFTP